LKHRVVFFFFFPCDRVESPITKNIPIIEHFPIFS
jgi:hypothetical protein